MGEMRLRPIAFAFVLALSGCGQSDEERRLADVEKRLETLAQTPIVGLGEYSPADIRAGWKTDFSRHTVPLAQFRSGGPGKDGIPAIERPRFRSTVATKLDEDEPVIELVVRGRARAYPLEIMVWHELVNDTVAGRPIVVTFCPLCHTALAFDRRLDGNVLSFGTTGNLRNSDLVMYDRQTESWWQQFGGAGVVGRHAGRRLERVPARIVSWGDFRLAHPRALVLSRDTGYSRDYGRDPYPGYDDVDSPPYFQVANSDDRRLAPKERVVFVEVGRDAFAVPRTVLARGPVRIGPLAMRLRGSRVDVRLAGRPVPFDEPFWFAVAAFRPDVQIVRESSS